MNDFWLCFVPLFVAVDAVGVVPIFVSLTEGLEATRLHAVIFQSVATASVIAVAFLVFGPALLAFLGITVPDFMIAGGILLLVISLNDLLTGEKRQRQADIESLGAVPLGIPLITGPAVLTTCILLANTHGKLITALAVVVNIAIAGIVFWFADPITRRFGRTGAKSVSKVASLFLAAIAVMLMRRGILEAIAAAGK
ncbi:MAG: MarC family protein [Desulfobacterales bacterium]|jgi:multiple antibiotic resistance protein|nr:MarC family protein [Desulfobacterales bacterium]MDD3080759.1 MarC family protein [Desulfobacterales bacterium]MDD3949579.1 MarC family protein [Desulfobacterales bacterium]MDY0377132.1 MarC family protein [Desulfobacterales bacterium]